MFPIVLVDMVIELNKKSIRILTGKSFYIYIDATYEVMAATKFKPTTIFKIIGNNKLQIRLTQH